MILSNFKETKTKCGSFYGYDTADNTTSAREVVKFLRIKRKKFRPRNDQEDYPIDIVQRLFVVAKRYNATHVQIFEHDGDNIIQDKVTVRFIINHTALSPLH